MNRIFFLALAALVLLACSNDLDPSSRIVKPRLLGADVRVNGDTARSTPRSGETLDLGWLFAENTAAKPITYVTLACKTRPARVGVSACEGGFFSLATQGELAPVSESSINNQVVVPPTLNGKVSIFMLICVESTLDQSLLMTAGLSGQIPSRLCTDPNAEQIFAILNLDVAKASAEPSSLNQIPSLDAIEIEKNTWSEVATTLNPGDACRGQGLVEITYTVTSDVKQKVPLVVRATGREDYSALRGDPPVEVPVKEELQLSILTTHGATSPRFAFIEGEDDFEEFDWLPDRNTKPGADGTLVRFFLTLRDGRGGFVWQKRDLCLIP